MLLGKGGKSDFFFFFLDHCVDTADSLINMYRRSIVYNDLCLMDNFTVLCYDEMLTCLPLMCNVTRNIGDI